MARTDITPTQLANFDGSAGANEFLAAGTASDATNGNAVVHTGREIILLTNTGPSARTMTVTSVADSKLGRTGNITTYSVPAGETHVIPPLPADGWRQADGKLYLDGSHAELVIRVLKLPPNLPL